MEPNESPTPPKPADVYIIDPDHYAGAVITIWGEREITDEMVQRACQALENAGYPFNRLPGPPGWH